MVYMIGVKRLFLCYEINPIKSVKFADCIFMSYSMFIVPEESDIMNHFQSFNSQ